MFLKISRNNKKHVKLFILKTFFQYIYKQANIVRYIVQLRNIWKVLDNQMYRHVQNVHVHQMYKTGLLWQSCY